MRQAHGHPVLVGADQVSTRLEMARFDDAGGRFDEAWLQKLIYDHPECLPIDQIEPGFDQVVSVCRELPTRHGPVDNLLISPEGDLVLVEVKLWRNPEARRKVVAQALDYASCLFEMDYAELEEAILRAQFGNTPKPRRLYDLFAGCDAKDEGSFVDAINANLRRGRALILVVGDGIRAEAARLANLVQSHAGAHFTFALVELAVFQTPDRQGLLVCPRILAQTEMISWAVVHIDDRRTLVAPDHRAPAAAVTTSGQSVAESITAEQFYEAMAKIRPDVPDRIRAFIAKLDALGVYPDFQRSLNLRWDPPSGKSINLGYIHRDGQVWTDAVNAKAPHEVSYPYIEELAAAFGMDVEKERMKPNWHVRTHGHAPRIGELADKLELWVPVIERFIARMNEWQE